MTTQPGSARAWLLACRPATLTAAVAPVLTGTAVSAHQGSVQLLPAAATFVGAGLLQIASNFANDVFDYEKGADTEERLGPTRAVQAGLITARAMKRALAIVVILALLLGVYLTSVAGWPIVAIGICSILAAIAYTGGPYPLGYHGLGDVFVMLFFGFVAVCGTAYVHLGSIPTLAWVAAYPLGAVTTNILVVNNLRDRHTDTRAGKKTLAVRFGRPGAEFEYIFLYLTSYLTPLAMWACGLCGPAAMFGLLSLPLAVLNIRGIRNHEGKDLNTFLVKSAKLVFLFGATLSAGIFFDIWLRSL